MPEPEVKKPEPKTAMDNLKIMVESIDILGLDSHVLFTRVQDDILRGLIDDAQSRLLVFDGLLAAARGVVAVTKVQV